LPLPPPPISSYDLPGNASFPLFFFFFVVRKQLCHSQFPHLLTLPRFSPCENVSVTCLNAVRCGTGRHFPFPRVFFPLPSPTCPSKFHGFSSHRSPSLGYHCAPFVNFPPFFPHALLSPCFFPCFFFTPPFRYGNTTPSVFGLGDYPVKQVGVLLFSQISPPPSRRASTL